VRGVVLQGPREITVEQVPDARLPGPDGAVITIEHTAICGSDLHLYHDAITGTGVQLGHEFIGTVHEVGPLVRSIKTGDRVLVSGVIGCGQCATCRAGQPALCQRNQSGIFGTGPDLPGGQAEAVGVPAADAFTLVIPDGINPEQAVLLTDILPTGFLGAQRADIAPGGSVAVIGLGPVGIMALQSSLLYSPARVFAIDADPARLARAARLGAETVDASDGTAVAKVMEATSGLGVTSVIEAVGADQTIIDALGMVAPGGTVSIVGVNLSMDMAYPMGLAFLKSLTVRATVAAIPGTWDALVPLLQTGRLVLDPVFTHHLPLSAAAEAYRIFDAHEDGVLKVLLDPTA
jgi:alcohol dehydrogenase